jgi:hypothetical protein
MAESRRPLITYVSPLLNRHSQLDGTFRQNIRVIEAFNGTVEWVILNMRSRATPDNKEWVASDTLIRTEGAVAISRGWLTYVTATVDSYHQSICRNVASRSVHGEFMIGLDIDNIISIVDTHRLISMGLEKLNGILYHGWDGVWGNGTAGMIGVTRKRFEEIGGYNEEFLPYGYEEFDLMNRLLAKYPELEYTRFGKRTVIQNTDEERQVNLTDTQTPLSIQNQKNRELSQCNIREGRYVCTPVYSVRIPFSTG